MSSRRLALPRVVPGDVEALERRARDLAGNGARGGEEPEWVDRLVAFRLAGRPCAVGAAAVSRAVPRLASAAAVPLADGTERAVAWVEEVPLAVADLAGALGPARAAADLAGQPALVLATPAGPVAVAVEGPLELREERLAAAALAAPDAAAGPVRPRLAGSLADGTSVIDEAWMVEWAGRAVGR
jgi:hypothetical protein